MAERWRLRFPTVLQVVQDGWMRLFDGMVPLRDVLDLEEMRMPGKWRARERAGLSATPPVYEDRCGHGWEYEP